MHSVATNVWMNRGAGLLIALAAVFCAAPRCARFFGADEGNESDANTPGHAGDAGSNDNAGGTGDEGTVNDGASDEGGGTDDTNASGQGSGIIADHAAAAGFDSIPDTFIVAAKSQYRIFYGHTSHGSQIVTGMEMLYAADQRFAFNNGSGTLHVDENDGVDLGEAGDLYWVDVTRDVLNQAGNSISLVMWSWCGGVSDNTQAGIDAYLQAMNQLESDYPNVTFVYMTGHLDGSGRRGNLYARNDQIREYCRTHSKVLFDFADIESYDPNGKYYAWGSDACEWCEDWCASHGCPGCDDCAHSACFNCYQKGKAFWWMMARLAGWNGQ